MSSKSLFVQLNKRTLDHLCINAEREEINHSINIFDNMSLIMHRKIPKFRLPLSNDLENMILSNEFTKLTGLLEIQPQENSSFR